MKWFKHISDSLDDPFIFDLIDRFGGDGYLVFFGTLEVMSREFDVNSPGTCRVSIKFLAKKLQISVKKLKNILEFCAKNGRIHHTIDGCILTLNCNKLKSLCDEYTHRNLKKKSGANRDNNTSDSVTTETETETETETDLKKPVKDGLSSHFSNKNNGYVEQIESEGKLIEKLKINSKLGKINIWQLIQEYTNKNTHPQAIYETLRALRGGWNGIKSSYQGYFRNILAKYNAKYNERDRIRACEAYKAELLQMPDSLLNLVKEIGV